jgi:hypothetical protein
MIYRQAGLLTLVSLSLVATPALAQEARGQESPPVAASSPKTAPGDTAVLDPYFDQQVRRARSQRPQPSAGRANGELVAGIAGGGVMAAGGFVLGGLSGFAWYAWTDEHCPAADECGDDDIEPFVYGGAGALLGVAALYPLGTGLGVGLAGQAGDHTGSIGAAIRGSYTGALAGAFTGVALGWLGAALTSNDSYGEAMVLGGAAGVLVGAPIGAWIGFDRTRAYDGVPPPPPLAGLVSMDESQARLTVPAISIAPDPLHAGHVVTSVRVLDARF